MIYGDDLRKAQGINFVIDNIVKGKDFFDRVRLALICGAYQRVDVMKGECMPIGTDAATPQYTIKRNIRGVLRDCLSSNFYLFALLKYYLNYQLPAHKSVNNYFESGVNADYIVFHDIFSAHSFLKTRRHIIEKTAIVVHAADDNMDQFFGKFPSFKGKKRENILKLRDFVFSRVNKVIYLSNNAYNLSKISKDKRCVIYNGIKDIPFEINNAERHIVNFCCVGSMTGWKGQDLIVEAFGILKKDYIEKVHLSFIGDGPERCKLENRVAELGLKEKVSFLGIRKDVPDLLKSQDVFIMPSINEGLSVAAIEATRAGLFLMLTDAGGNREVMGEGGIVIERDVLDIETKICEVIDKNYVSLEQKHNTRKHFEDNFTIEQCVRSYENVLLSL